MITPGALYITVAVPIATRWESSLPVATTICWCATTEDIWLELSGDMEGRENMIYDGDGFTSSRSSRGVSSHKDVEKFLGFRMKTAIRSPTANTLIRPGRVFDIAVLDRERERVTAFLKERGYYNFTVNNIDYVADTLGGNHQVDVQVNIKQYLTGYNERGQAVMDNNMVYRIDRINGFKMKKGESAVLCLKGLVEQSVELEGTGEFYSCQFLIMERRPENINWNLFREVLLQSVWMDSL